MQTPTHTRDQAEARRYTLPPPSSPEVLWTKVVQLLTDTKGFVTYEKFEEAFELPSTHGKYGKDGRSRVYEAGRDWYFKTEAVLGDTAVDGIPPTREHHLHTFFGMEFPPDAFGDWKEGTCILGGEASKALVASGWALRERRVWMLYANLIYDEFVMGGSSVRLYHYSYYIHSNGANDDATCVTKFDVRSAPQ
jgi:hypothetical protein